MFHGKVYKIKSVNMLKLSMTSDVFSRKDGERSLVTLTLFSDMYYMMCENDVIEDVT